MKQHHARSSLGTTSAAHIFALLSILFALTLTACSTATTPAETRPSETNMASANTPSTGSGSTNDDLAGTYAVDGTGADGATYQGEVVVTKRDAVHQMSWKVGADEYDGVAVQSGNTLAVAYTIGTDGKGCGAVIYKINADNSLDGNWGEWGVNSIGTEKAVPIGAFTDSVGTFNIIGTNANSSAYKGNLTISKSGNEIYQFGWDTGTKFIGTGVKMGEYLAAGWGPKQCGFVIYEIKGDTLEGKWGVPGSTALGTEKATKQ